MKMESFGQEENFVHRCLTHHMSRMVLAKYDTCPHAISEKTAFHKKIAMKDVCHVKYDSERLT